MQANLVGHGAEDFYCVVGALVFECLKAFKDDLLGNLVVQVKLNYQLDVSKHLLLLPVSQLDFIKDEQHLFVEIILKMLLNLTNRRSV